MDFNEINKYLREQGKDIDVTTLASIIEAYTVAYKKWLLVKDKEEAIQNLISRLNYHQRGALKSSELMGFKVKVGDVCYIDFGEAYITEAGYQHFGLVVSYYNSKALVIPMTSNEQMYQQSYCPKTFPIGKQHLFRLGYVKGLNKKSVLFLNGAQYINTARVIEIKGYIHPKSELFQNIKRQFLNVMKLND